MLKTRWAVSIQGPGPAASVEAPHRVLDPAGCGRVLRRRNGSLSIARHGRVNLVGSIPVCAGEPDKTWIGGVVKFLWRKADVKELGFHEFCSGDSVVRHIIDATGYRAPVRGTASSPGQGHWVASLHCSHRQFEMIDDQAPRQARKNEEPCRSGSN